MKVMFRSMSLSRKPNNCFSRPLKTWEILIGQWSEGKFFFILLFSTPMSRYTYMKMCNMSFFDWKLSHHMFPSWLTAWHYIFFSTDSTFLSKVFKQEHKSIKTYTAASAWQQKNVLVPRDELPHINNDKKIKRHLSLFHQTASTNRKVLYHLSNPW